MLEAQDSPTLRIAPRFLAIEEGDTVTSSPVHSFLRMKRSSVLLRLSLRWCTAVQAEMSARHSEILVACGYKRMGEKRGTVWCCLHNSGKRFHVMWLQPSNLRYIETEVLILSIEGHPFLESRVWTRSLWPERCDLSAMMWPRLEQGQRCQVGEEDLVADCIKFWTAHQRVHQRMLEGI